MYNKIRMTLLFAMLIIISTCQISLASYSDWQSEETVDSDTIGLWHWNESSGNAANSVIGGLSLYPNGIADYSVGGGKFGNGANCPGTITGTDYWQISNDSNNGYNLDALESDASLSVAVWIKPDVLPTTENPRQVLVDKAYSTDPNAGYTMYLWYASGVTYLKAAIGTTSGTPVKESRVVYLYPGKWSHIAMTWNAATDTLKVYQDGSLLGSTASAGSVYAPSIQGSTNPRVLRIGERLGTVYGGFSGKVDDLKISKIAVDYAPYIPVVEDGDYYGWVNEEIVDDKTIGLWHWNESSGNANSAVPGGLPLYRYGLMGYDVGKFGNGALCPGGVASTDYWQIANNIGGVWGVDMDSAGPDPNLSIGVWVKPNQLPTSASPRQMIFDKANSHTPTAGYQMYLWYENSNSSIYLRAVIGTTAGTRVQAQTNITNLTVGQWTHLAMVWDADDDTLRLYEDGAQIAAATDAGKIYRPSDGYNGATMYLLRVGNRIGSAFGTFNGVIDDLKVSRAALKYVLPPPPPITGPYYDWLNDYNGTDAYSVALWNFDTPHASGLGTGQSAKDVITGDTQKLYLYGSPAIVTEGKFSWGLHLPGDQNGLDYTQVIGGGAGIFPSGSDSSLSVECWLNINDVSGQSIQYIFDKQYADKNGFKMFLSRDQIADPGIAAPDYRLHFVTGDGTATVDVSEVLRWEQGKWYHVAGTWDANSDTAKLYRSGNLVAAVSSPGMQIANSTQNLRIGQRLGAAYWAFDGNIDNARISNNAYNYSFDCDLANLPMWSQGDISGPEGQPDCYIDFYDVALLAEEWLNGEYGSFFDAAPDYSAGYDDDKLYPNGKIFGFSFYSVTEPDIYNLKNDGFTAMGPYYGSTPGNYLDEASSLGLKYFYHVGMTGLDPENFVLPSDSEIQAAVTAQVNAVKNDNTIAVWVIQPEELKYNQPNQMHYLQVAADAIRAADSAQGRPVWMYETNNRTDDQLAVSVAHQDLCGKGMYTNFTGNQNNRIYCKWTIEQELNAIGLSNPSATAIAVPEMFVDPDAQFAYLIPIWARHDVYLSLITGAKGVEIFSGWRRPELINYFDEYYQGYASVARELNGDLNLGQVFLFGQRRSDISVTITSGPATASMTTPEAYTASSVNYANIADTTGARYLFLVNSANSDVTVNISGLPAETIRRQDIFDSTDYAAMNGDNFSVTLAPLAVKCYRFVPGGADISGPTGISDGKINMFDFATMAENWMECENPEDLQCQ